MSQTSACIVCLKPAEVWSGHVLRGNRKVLAGWCVEHRRLRYRMKLMGDLACYGGWHRRYGDNFMRRKP